MQHNNDNIILKRSFHELYGDKHNDLNSLIIHPQYLFCTVAERLLYRSQSPMQSWMHRDLPTLLGCLVTWEKTGTNELTRAASPPPPPLITASVIHNWLLKKRAMCVFTPLVHSLPFLEAALQDKCLWRGWEYSRFEISPFKTTAGGPASRRLDMQHM